MKISAIPPVVFLSLVLLCGSCGKQTDDQQHPLPAGQTILPKNVKLKEGDVVFRLGGGIMSAAVLEADPDGGYSHCGIVADSAGTLVVVHAVPGEPDFEGDPDRVKMESPEKFFIRENASTGAVVRPKDAAVGHKAAQIAMQAYRRHTLFDNDFDNEDTTKMYCTELLVHAFRKAGRPIVGEPQHHFNIPAAEITCWMPSDIYESDFFSLVARFPTNKKANKK